MIHIRNVKLVAVSVLLTILSVVTAYYRAFSGQNLLSNDDEGMLMTVIRRFLEGDVLYDRIKIFYGPLYYFYEWCAHALTGTPVSHDSVRFVSMFFWVTCALLLFLLVYRATNSLLLAAVAHFLSFRALSFIGTEPGHPQELCITLLVALGLAACSISSRILLMISFGALAAAMTATKINLGVFAVIALTLALLFGLKRGWRRSALLIATGGGALIFPLVLMWGHLADSWAEKYCIVAVVSLGASIFVVSQEEFEFSVSINDFLFAGSGFVISVMTIGWFAVAHGSSVHGMIDSLIFQPQRSFGRSWFLQTGIPAFAVPWALMGLTSAWLVATRRADESVMFSLKLAFAVSVGFLSLWGLYYMIMSYLFPFVWLVVIRPGKTLTESIGSLPRAVLAILTVTQMLYAYPVAGSQVPFTTVVMIAVAAICVSDSLPYLNARFPRLGAPGLSHALVPPLAILYIFFAVWAIRQYEGAGPLGLPGAERMRIDHEKADLVHRLATRVGSSSCTMLASVPGLLSFNFLSGKPAPRSINLTGWVLGLSDADQQEVIVELSGARYPCFLYNQSIADVWRRGADVSSKPLMRYMKDNFQVVFETSGYSLMEPRRTTLIP